MVGGGLQNRAGKRCKRAERDGHNVTIDGLVSPYLAVAGFNRMDIRMNRVV